MRLQTGSGRDLLASASASTAISRGATSTRDQAFNTVYPRAAAADADRVAELRHRSMPCSHPPATPYLYFVSRGDGSSEFSASHRQTTIAPWQNTSARALNGRVQMLPLHTTGQCSDACAAHIRRRGRFITVEGIDGAGKSTHLPLAQADARARRPRGVAHARAGRHAARRATTRSSPARIDDAPGRDVAHVRRARREHCEREIWPRLAAGTWVVCDRFTDATTYAYQGGGYGVPRETIAALERNALDGFRPDVTLVFDVPARVGRERLVTSGRRTRAGQVRASVTRCSFERVRAV